MKLCVFPNDPIKTYYKKGEIKTNYFNPNNIFDEIHVISLTEKEVESDKVRQLFGNASFKIHCVGKVGLTNISRNKDRILELVKEIQPDVIRAYTTLVPGWLASYCSKKLKIPLYLSIHVQYDNLRNQYKHTDMKKYLSLKYSERYIEPYVLKTATMIAGVYKIIDTYVTRLSGRHIDLVYNSIDYNAFSNAKKILDFDKPLIISVGRLTKQKNHDILIRAMKKIDAYLLIIGDGELESELKSLVNKLDLGKKIIFKKSVPHSEIHGYYKSADIFALAYDTNIEGIPIPVMEAMATDLPVVIPYPPKGISEGLEDVAKFVERNSNAVAKAINELLADITLYNDLAKKSKEKAKEFDVQIIENKEASIYLSLVNTNRG